MDVNLAPLSWNNPAMANSEGQYSILGGKPPSDHIIKKLHWRNEFFNALGYLMHVQKFHSFWYTILWILADAEACNYPHNPDAEQVHYSASKDNFLTLPLCSQTLLPPLILSSHWPALLPCVFALPRMSCECNQRVCSLLSLTSSQQNVWGSFMLLHVSGKSLFFTHKSLNSRARWNLKDQSQTSSFPRWRNRDPWGKETCPRSWS